METSDLDLSQLSEADVEALHVAAVGYGISIGSALSEAVRAYAKASHEARFAAALDWTLDEHHDVLVKLGE